MKLKLLFFLMPFFTLAFLIPSAHAQRKVDILHEVCRTNPSATVCEEKEQGKRTNPLYGPQGVISSIVNILSLVVGLAAVIGIIVAGVKYITSASNPQEANQARELVIYAVIGLAIAVIAQLLVRTVLFRIGVT